MAQVVVGAGRNLSRCTGRTCPTSFARSPSQKCHAVSAPGRVMRSIGSTPTIQCLHCGIRGSLPNSARSDIAARGADLPATGTGCSSGDGEPGPSNFA